MYQKTAINIRLAKIQAKIYELETLAFKTTEECNKLINQICELVAVRYREAKRLEKKSHNLCSEDLSNATAITLEAIQKAKKEQDEISKKIKGAKNGKI